MGFGDDLGGRDSVVEIVVLMGEGLGLRVLFFAFFFISLSLLLRGGNYVPGTTPLLLN